MGIPFSSCGRGFTWRAIPGIVSGEDHPPLRPFGTGTTAVTGLTNHGSSPLAKWDDSPSRVCVGEMNCESFNIRTQISSPTNTTT